MNLDNELQKTQDRLAAANRESIRAEGIRHAAQQALHDAEEKLHSEYGVRGLENARQLLRELTEELDTCVKNMNALLDKIDGGGK